MTDTTTTLALPPNVDGSNGDRADRVLAALDIYARNIQGVPLAEADAQEVIGDFFSDLRHLLDRINVEGSLDEKFTVEVDGHTVSDGAAAFDVMLSRGSSHYLAETGRAPY